jgi:transcriptional regulator with GAF, ATPase, and Fis domain
LKAGALGATLGRVDFPDTIDNPRTARRGQEAQRGVVIVFSGSVPLLVPIACDVAAVSLGRATPLSPAAPDARMSREHAEIHAQEDGFMVRDLGSRNGTYVNGHRVEGTAVAAHPSVIRMGQTLAVTCPSLWPFVAAAPMRQGGRIIGPTLGAALSAVDLVAASSDSVLISGESGSGKELAAARFHAAGPHRDGPFVPVNCASVPEGVAERLLFGAKRGAYSGATQDVEGYAQAADKGVLFLDEFGELDLEVQAKLLRMVETKEVLPLGASRARRLDVRLCFATHKNLRAEVAAGRFRSDLFYRIGHSHVALPPLRERREEIPWHVEAEVARAGGMGLTAELVEACMLRAWPGNVRELLGEVRRAVLAAQAAGARTLRPEHLAMEAGTVIEPSEAASAALPLEPTPKREPVSRARVLAALQEQPNASAAAKALGIHRSHLYRLMRQFDLDKAGGP